MHCPRCGTAQQAEAVKFCSKCGMPLGWVAEIVRNGGELPQLARMAQGGMLTRGNGLKFSLIWFLLIVFLIVPLIAILGGEEIVAILAVIGSIGAIILAVLSFLFLKPAVKPSLQLDARVRDVGNVTGYQSAQGTLPPADSQSANAEVSASPQWKSFDTGELVSPGSVTEGTTKLLQMEKDES
ncbi:MAG: zinc ribbon domain-containing protein [Pyrinomonadaceae bacterium]